ncbi:MAG: hypothetical protein ACI4UT_02745, partial [Candidatus Enteromonas sp.]
MDPFDSFFESIASRAVLGFKASRRTASFLSPFLGQNGACSCLGKPADLGDFLSRFSRGFEALEGNIPDWEGIERLESHASLRLRRRSSGHLHVADFYPEGDT